MRNLQIGVLTIGYGDKRFVKQAELLAISVKLNMPDMPVALVSDIKEINSPWFDHIIPLNPAFGGGVLQKLYLNKYSPFQETLFVDSDCIVSRSFDNELREIRKHDFTPVCGCYLTSADSDQYLDDLGSVMQKLGISRFPKFNSGILFFNKTPAAEAIFETARGMLARRSELGIRNFDKHGPNDETLYSIALGLQNRDLYNDGQLMITTARLEGKLNINPLGGGCSFISGGQKVQPAICHFIRSSVLTFPYLKCEWILRRKAGQLGRLDESVPFLLRAAAGLCVRRGSRMRYHVWMRPRQWLERRRKARLSP